MESVIRTYTGPGAKALTQRIGERRTDVEAVIRAVPGLVSYAFIETAEGGMSVTVCQDKAGIDESVRVAREWIGKNASDIETGAPTVTEGTAVVRI